MSTSTRDLLTLHAVRLLGFAPTGAVAGRFALDRAETAEHLEDFRARGWVTHSEFGGRSGWSLTDSGREEDERRLAEELAAADGAAAVRAAYDDFRRLNSRVLRAMTDWQIRPTPRDVLAANDHTDWKWDERVLRGLAGVGRRLGPLAGSLVDVLDRFRGYDDRFLAALAEVDRGRRSYVDGIDVDSCHLVWFQLHEDLLATLGIERGEEPGD